MKKITAAITALSIYLFLAAPIWAQEITIVISPPRNVTPITNLGKLISSLISVILVVATLAAFFYLLWGGVQWIISGGDKTAVEGAQHRIQAAIVGLIIVFCAWAIFAVLGQFLGIDPFNLKLPSPAGT